MCVYLAIDTEKKKELMVLAVRLLNYFFALKYNENIKHFSLKQQFKHG